MNGPVAMGQTSSHVNLGEITYYNEKAQRQRPQTGKSRAMVNQGPLRVTSFNSNVGNSHQQRRLTSAKGGEARTKGRAPLDSQLSNTRDIIQSFGHLTTAAATNYDPQYRTSQQHSLVKPIVRQHFVPSANQRQRLQSAKPQNMLTTNNMLALQSANESGTTRFRSVARPKSGVSSKRASRRLLSANQKAESGGQKNQTQQIKNGVFLDQTGQEIDIQELIRSENDPINLNLGAGIVPQGMKSVPTSVKHKTQTLSTAANTKYTSRQHRQFSTKYNLTKTIYRLPSLSQCIENKILPRSSEYMRRLYSIAVRNHENHIPTMINIQKAGNQSDPVQVKVELKVDPNSAEQHMDIQEAILRGYTPNTLAQRNTLSGQHASILSQNPTPEDPTKAPQRSRSFATLNVKNLQFPFDNSLHGGFSKTKQRDLNLNRNPQPEIQSLENSVSPKKRPFTAGRMRTNAIPSIDLFNNKFISEATNQVSTNPLITTTANNNLPEALQQLLEQQQIVNSEAEQYSAEVLLQDSKPGNNLTIMTGDPQVTSPKIQYVDSKAQIVIGLKSQMTPRDGSKKDYAQVTSDVGVVSPVSNLNPPSRDSPNSRENPLEHQRGYSDDGFSPERHHSVHESPVREKDPALTSFFRKSGGDNSHSQRDFKPVHFKEKNGTQLIVQMSGQGLTTKRLNSNDSASQTSRSGQGKKKKSKTRLSSTHSLQVNVQTAQPKDSDQHSQANTNRLDESEEVCIDERGVRIMENKDSDKFNSNDSVSHHSRRSQSFTRNSRSSFMSNKDLDHLKEKMRPKRQSFPVRPMTAKQRQSQHVDDSHVSLQSQSQNMLDQQMRLKQVYDNEQQQSGQKVIHRIPIPNKNGEFLHLQSQRNESARHQVLVVTNDPRNLKEIAGIQEGSVSNMSNPLNHIQMSVDRMKPIRIKSVVFDSKGNPQISEAQRLGLSVIEQVTVVSDRNSPSRDCMSPHNLKIELYDIEDSKFIKQQMPEEQAHAHKQFKVTMNVKRGAPKPPVDPNTQVQQPPKPAQATLRGKSMRIQSAKQRIKKPSQERNRHIIEMLNSKQELTSSTPNLGLMENSKATVHNVPPLALPTTETITDFLGHSQIPSSHRQNVSYSQTSVPLVKQQQQSQNENLKALNSFNANNVRTNLKGDLAKRLMHGIDLSDRQTIPADTMNAHLRLSNQSNSHSPLRQKPTQKLFQRMQTNGPVQEEAMQSLEKLGQSLGDSKSSDFYNTQREFAATLKKERSLDKTRSDDSIEKRPEVKIDKTVSIDAKEDEGPATITDQILNIEERDGSEGQVIQEQEECGSSERSRSKISVSVQSFKKAQVHHKATPTINIEPIEGSEKKDLLIAPSSQVLRKPTSTRNVYESFIPSQQSGIRSVYEAEAQAMKRGLIKAYSGKVDAASKRSRHNTDLQHFLTKKGSQQEETSVRNSYKKSELSTRNPSKLVRHQSFPSNSQQKEKDKDKEEKKPQITQQRSSINFNITNVHGMVQKKPIEERPRTFSPQGSPQERQNIVASQLLHQEALKKAQELMEQAKLLKLDPAVVNKKLIELFSDKNGLEAGVVPLQSQKKDFKRQELGTQTFRQVERLEIPFHISTIRNQAKQSYNTTTIEKDAVSIMTRKLSSSTYNKNETQIKAPSFAPNSPVSNVSTVRNNEVITCKPGFNFAINSVGGSTTRFSKGDLPQFGGVRSSRIGELLGSQHTDVHAKETSLVNDSYEFMIPGPSTVRKLRVVAAPIIDYSQNIMSTQVLMSKGSTDMITQLSNGQRSIDAFPVSKLKKHDTRKRRPQTASRYNKNQTQLNTESQKDERLASAGQMTHVIPAVIFEHQNEHRPQPEWALRQNLKSKFNMMTQEEQAKQVQKFFIDCRNRDANFSPERALTQLITQQVTSSPSKLRYNTNESDITNPVNLYSQKNTIKEQLSGDELDSPSRTERDSPILVKKVCSMPVEYAKQRAQLGEYGRDIRKDEIYAEEAKRGKETESSVDAKETTRNSCISLKEDNSVTPQQREIALSDDKSERMLLEKTEVQVHNQSMQCSLAPTPLDETHLSGLIAQEYQVTSDAKMGSQQTSTSKQNTNFELRSSNKSLVNSRKVLEKAATTKYVGRSQAMNTHFSVAGSLINSNRSKRTQNQ